MPFAEVKDLTTDLINKLRSEASSEANAGEDPFSKVKESITDLINRLQSETRHKSCCDDELTKSSEERGL